MHVYIDAFCSGFFFLTFSLIFFSPFREGAKEKRKEGGKGVLFFVCLTPHLRHLFFIFTSEAKVFRLQLMVRRI